VVAGGPADEQGEVEFEASFVRPAGAGERRERSGFVRRAGRWVYVDGDLG
jgi:SEC-C motif-containing protein